MFFDSIKTASTETAFDFEDRDYMSGARHGRERNQYKKLTRSSRTHQCHQPKPSRADNHSHCVSVAAVMADLGYPGAPPGTPLRSRNPTPLGVPPGEASAGLVTLPPDSVEPDCRTVPGLELDSVEISSCREASPSAGLVIGRGAGPVSLALENVDIGLGVSRSEASRHDSAAGPGNGRGAGPVGSVLAELPAFENESGPVGSVLGDLLSFKEASGGVTPLVCAYMTDVEGNLEYFKRFVDMSEVLQWADLPEDPKSKGWWEGVTLDGQSKPQQLDFKADRQKDGLFVFGGDSQVWNGPADLY